MQTHRGLFVWQKSYAFALAMYQATEKFPKHELYGITSQLCRAAVSVPTNIAEGYNRQSRAEYLRFLAFAQGSVGELDTLLSLAHNLTYLDDIKAKGLMALLVEIRRMLTRLIQKLREDPEP